jgi:AhpD family alkylhydroperoxidase
VSTAAPVEGSSGQAPRVLPGGRRDVGFLNYAIARFVSGRLGASHRLNVFTTIARSRKPFRGWVRFAREVTTRSSIPKADAELVILRIAHNCNCEYERLMHEPIAAKAGLSKAEIVAVAEGPAAGAFSSHQQALLRAVDELNGKRCLADGTWSELRQGFSDEQMIELCMLVGNYEMVAMILNTLRVEPDPE